MPERKPEIDGSSVVLVGSFNPQIFQPEWFARQNLLPQTEVDVAEVKVIAKAVSQFETERFLVQVTADKFIAMSKATTNAALLRDLVMGTFFILEHTPVEQMGMNRQMHFPTDSEEQWHKIGDKLVPKDAWRDIMKERPGMKSLSVFSERKEPPGSVTIKVEPSTTLKHGVYFEMNDHYEKLNKATPTFIDILKNRWEEAQNYASKAANHVLDWAIS